MNQTKLLNIVSKKNLRESACQNLRKSARTIFTILFLFIASAIHSQTYKELSQTETCIKKIKSTSNSLNTLQSDFNELKHSSMFKNPIPGNGKLYFQKKDNIRWEQMQPSKNVIIISGGKIKIFENGKEIRNVATNKIGKKVQDLMLQLISGDFLNQKDFSIKYFGNNVHYKLELTPKNNRMKKYISKIEALFDVENAYCQQLTFFENESNYTNYTFVNQKINQNLPGTIFKKL